MLGWKALTSLLTKDFLSYNKRYLPVKKLKLKFMLVKMILYYIYRRLHADDFWYVFFPWIIEFIWF